jgi:DNA replicative helicase MCM subunit Mcm2 (Cdc46/Mcm family)
MFDIGKGDMDYEDAVEEFNEFFYERCYEAVDEAVRTGRSYVSVDFQEMDAFEFKLSEFLIENPSKGLSAAEEGLEEIDLITDENLNVRFKNMLEEDNVLLKDLRSEHIGEFISISGVIVDATDISMNVVSAEFQCTNCGEIVEKEQEPGQDLKAPYKCDSCGSRKFEVHNKIHQDVQEITLRSTLGNSNVKLKGRLTGSLVTPKNELLDKEVNVTGVLQANEDGEKYLQVNSLEEEKGEKDDKVPDMLSDLVKESFDIEDLDSFLDALDPFKFEELLAEIFQKAGYRTEVKQKTGDKGIDVVCRRRFPYFEKILIQAKCKSESSSISSSDIQQYNSLKDQEPNVDQVLLIATCSYSAQAKDLASKLDIKIMNRDNVKYLLTKYEEAKEDGVIEVKAPKSYGEEQQTLEEEDSVDRRGVIQNVKTIIDDMAKDAKDYEVEIDKVREKAEKEGFSGEAAEDVIDTMKRDGELYEPKQGYIQPIEYLDD